VSRYKILITLKPALLDPAGRAVNEALHSLGFDEVDDVRIGKLIEVTTKNGDASRVEEMCSKLLANPVIETYQVESAE
jgi:phosphoribosylformylglycinamidine synthase